jgi:hypothetical protein
VWKWTAIGVRGVNVTAMKLRDANTLTGRQTRAEARVLRCLPIFACIIWFVGTALHLDSQTGKPAEYQVKAVYMVNFIKFIEWPAGTLGNTNEPFPVCVLGQDPFGPALDQSLAGERIDQHPLAAHRIQSARDAAGCRVVFISASSDSQIEDTLVSLEGESILTVSDTPRFVRRGGMIEFVREGNRVRFELNLAAAKMARLTVSSELLRVAAAVRGAP